MSCSPRTASIHGIVLAAGASRRLGSPKQLLEFGGKTLVRHAVEMAASILGEKIMVVLKSQTEVSPFDLADFAFKIVENPRWEEGMASSICTGIVNLPKDADAVLLLTIDQPLIDVSQLRLLVKTWKVNQACIVASEYAHTVGIPAIFPRQLFPELKTLQGDRGAKQLLKQYAEKLISVSIPEAAFDVDTWSDWEEIQGKG